MGVGVAKRISIFITFKIENWWSVGGWRVLNSFYSLHAELLSQHLTLGRARFFGPERPEVPRGSFFICVLNAEVGRRVNADSAKVSRSGSHTPLDSILDGRHHAIVIPKSPKTEKNQDLPPD